MYHNMYDRCYRESYLQKNPKYRGCTICDEWLNDHEAFYNWVAENYYIIDGEQIDLDKDILVKGNKIYSPKTCIYAPHSINTFYENMIRKPTLLPSGRYQMQMQVGGKRVTIGTFDTEEEAKLEFIKHKEAALIAKADLYKDKIPAKLYDSMVNFKLELSDWD